MRSVYVLVAAHAVLVSAVLAQEPTKSPPFLVAVGPTWSRTPDLTGLHLRAEYHFVRDRWVGLRVELGGRWTPTQSFSQPSGLYGEGSRLQGAWQYADINVGLAATLTPLPRRPAAPYLLVGVAAVQAWNHGHSYYTNSQGGLAYRNPSGSSTRGEIAALLGVGMRLRVGNRAIQLELRNPAPPRDLTIGTTLRF